MNLRPPLKLAARMRLRPAAGAFGGMRLPGWVARQDARLILAGLLGLVLLAELLPHGGAGGTLPAPSLPNRSAAIDADDVQGWTQTILARPLFTPGRRPAASAASDNGLPRLSAILIGQGTARAIFAVDGQKPIVLQQGGLVNGDKVQSISADTVVLLTEAGLVSIHPRFAKGGPSATPAAPTPPTAAVSPKTGQPLGSSTTAGPYDNE